MAAEWTFDPGIVIDDVTLEPQANGTGIFALTVGGSAQPVFDLNASSVANLVSNDNGYVARFRANSPLGFVNFGSVWQPVVAYEVFANAANISTLTAAALAAQTAAEAAEAAAESLAAGGGGGGAVASVNGRTGAVVLAAVDVNARSSLVPVPAGEVSGLATVATTGDYGALANRPAAAVPLAEKGVASGVATLDVAGKLVNAQLPANVGRLTISQASDGTWPLRSTVSSNPADRVEWFAYSAVSPDPAAGGGYFGPNDIYFKKV